MLDGFPISPVRKHLPSGRENPSYLVIIDTSHISTASASFQKQATLDQVPAQGVGRRADVGRVCVPKRRDGPVREGDCPNEVSALSAITCSYCLKPRKMIVPFRF